MSQLTVQLISEGSFVQSKIAQDLAVSRLMGWQVPRVNLQVVS